MVAMADGQRLRLLEFADREDLSRQLSRATTDPHPGAAGPATLEILATELAEYFQGERQVFQVPYRQVGTEFQRQVWEELIRIQYGKTCRYRDVADRLGQPNAVRAVGGCVGANALALIVPCHRVVGTAGKLTGYAGGLERKRWLLNFEAGCPPNLFGGLPSVPED